MGFEYNYVSKKDTNSRDEDTEAGNGPLTWNIFLKYHQAALTCFGDIMFCKAT